MEEEKAPAKVLVRMSAKAFASKFRSKSEVFVFLATDCNAYLAHVTCYTIYFLKDLITGNRKCKSTFQMLTVTRADIKNTAVMTLYAPQYDNLRVEDIMEQAFKFKETADYLPPLKDQHRLPRQFLINLVYSIVGEPFKLWLN